MKPRRQGKGKPTRPKGSRLCEIGGGGRSVGGTSKAKSMDGVRQCKHGILVFPLVNGKATEIPRSITFLVEKPVALHQGKEDTKPHPLARSKNLSKTEALPYPTLPRGHQDAHHPTRHHKTREEDGGQPRLLGCCFSPPPMTKTPKSSRDPMIWLCLIVSAIFATAVIITGIVVFAIYLIYKPTIPFIKVADAHLNTLDYDQSGLLDTEMVITIVAENDNSKAHARLSRVSFNLRFHGIKIAELRAAPFNVPKNSSIPLVYLVRSATVPLDQGGMEAMDAALKQGVVPFGLDGQSRTRWKLGIVKSVGFWTHLSCEIRFSWPDGSVVNPLNCSSKAH